jgi:hypothetical protein
MDRERGAPEMSPRAAGVERGVVVEAVLEACAGQCW